MTIQEMIKRNLVNGLAISEMNINGICEDCILSQQTHHSFDDKTKKDLKSLDLIAFNLWGCLVSNLLGRRFT